MGSKEDYYDNHIAPKLLEICKDCEANGLSFLAVCEFEPEKTGLTLTLQFDSGIGIRMTEEAARARGNIDAFIMAMARHARKNGHSSIYMSELGIPTKPKESANGSE